MNCGSISQIGHGRMNMKVIDGGFGKKKDEEGESKKPLASDVLQAAADFASGIEEEGYEHADVVVIYQAADSPCIVMSNQKTGDMDRVATLLQFATQDVLAAIWQSAYSTQEEEEYDGPLH